jgi:hypothetical protein
MGFKVCPIDYLAILSYTCRTGFDGFFASSNTSSIVFLRGFNALWMNYPRPWVKRIHALQCISKARWEYGHRLFHCVAVASRPLRVEELAEFLAFEFGERSIPDFNPDWRPENPEGEVLTTCSSLILIVNVGGSRVIQFSHCSVKEYLTSKRIAEAGHAVSQ